MRGSKYKRPPTKYLPNSNHRIANRIDADQHRNLTSKFSQGDAADAAAGQFTRESSDQERKDEPAKIVSRKVVRRRIFGESKQGDRI